MVYENQQYRRRAERDPVMLNTALGKRRLTGHSSTWPLP
jgi:hypothetical protein